MNNKKNNIDWKLFAKHFANETGEEENKIINRWVNHSVANKQTYDSLKEKWEQIVLLKNMDKVNVDNAWNRLKDRILNDTQMPVSKRDTKILPVQIPFYMRIAASILVIIGLGIVGYWGYNIWSNYNKTIITCVDETNQKILLPDGSTVYLNHKAQIIYPDKFGHEERKIDFTGEAFFEIVNNQNMPFIIHTNDAKIKVLGTSFNVNTSNKKHKTEVFVKTGKVQFGLKGNQKKEITIEPGFIGTISNKKINKYRNTDINYLSWKTRKIIFRETLLKDVVITLNHVYKSNIQINNVNIENLKLSATFDNQSLEEVIDIIETTFNITSEQNDNKIILK